MNQSPVETALSRAMIKWSLSKANLVAETPTSWLYRVEQSGSAAAALKIIKPDARVDEKRSFDLLDWYGGDGAVAVFDRTAESLFCEWVEPPSLAEMILDGRDEEAVAVVGQVVRSLHRSRDRTPPALIALHSYFEMLFTVDLRYWPPTAKDLYARAVGIAIGLFDRPPEAIPLHGDLSFENILQSPRGWLAIDPRGLSGDPAFDVASVFLGPANGTIIAGDARRSGRLAAALSAELGFSPRHVLGYAAALVTLNACKELAAKRAINRQLALLPTLLAAYDAA